MTPDDKPPPYTFCGPTSSSPAAAPQQPAAYQPYAPPQPPPPSQYWTRMAERVQQWREKNPERYQLFEYDARRVLELPAEGELSPAKARVVYHLVAEKIRVEKHWPTQDEFEGRI